MKSTSSPYLPCHTLPHPTSPHLILPRLTLTHFNSPYLTPPYLAYPTLPYLPRDTLPYHTIPYLSHHTMPYPTPPCLAPPRPTIPHHTPPAELPAQGDICETLLLELSQPRIGITTANAFAAVEGDIPSTAIERAACKGECKKATCVWARTASGSHADGRLRGMAKRAYEDGEDGVAQPQHHRAAPRSRPRPACPRRLPKSDFPRRPKTIPGVKSLLW